MGQANSTSLDRLVGKPNTVRDGSPEIRSTRADSLQHRWRRWLWAQSHSTTIPRFWTPVDISPEIQSNAFVQEAAAHGLTLHLPSGRQLRYYESHIIEPQAPLGDTLDFSQEAIQHSLQAGWEQAKIVLGD